MHTVWIRIDATLPWIELKETYKTRNEAQKGVQDFLKSMRVRIVHMPDNARQVKALITVKSRR
jgi:hypothetical protein